MSNTDDDDVLIEIEGEDTPAQHTPAGGQDDDRVHDDDTDVDGDDDYDGDAKPARTDRERLQAERRHKRRLQTEKASLKREVASLREMVESLVQRQGGSEEYLVAQIAKSVGDEYEAARAARTRALEGGDPTEIQTADDRLYEARRKRDQLEAELEARKRQPQPRQPAPQANPARDAWIGTNDDWFNRPGYEAATTFTKVYSQQLHARGIDPRDPRHFEELDKEIERRFPELFEPEATPANNRKKPPQTVAGGQRTPSGNGTVEVPNALIEVFKMAGEIGQNPTKEEMKMVRRYYMETKQGKGF